MLGFINHVKENIVQASFANLCPSVWEAAKAEQSKQPATGSPRGKGLSQLDKFLSLKFEAQPFNVFFMAFPFPTNHV